MPQPKESLIQQYLAKYKHPVTTKGDVLNTLRHYRGLQAKLDKFVFDDGTQQELFCLEGTIPVQFKGNTYNIPVCIWLMLQHPVHAPLAFVKPTHDMQIKVSRHVDHNGKVYLPYLSEWSQSSSDLLGLIQVLIIIFSETPPVFARPKNSAQYPPATTPYPAQPGYPGVGPPSGGGYPPYPPQQSAGVPYPVQPSAAYPSYPPAYQPPGGATYHQPQPTGGAAYNQPPTGGPAPYPVSTQSAASGGGVADGTGTIGEEHIRASLLSAVQDKVRRRVRELTAQAQAELDVLTNTERDLQTGRDAVEASVKRLEHEQNTLEERLTILRSRNSEMTSTVDKIEKEEPVDIDEAVLTTAPVYNQLLATFAEENATQDAIYHLGEALGHGVIDLETFLKQCRTMSRRQFMLRATMQRCRQKAGLPG